LGTEYRERDWVDRNDRERYRDRDDYEDEYRERYRDQPPISQEDFRRSELEAQRASLRDLEAEIRQMNELARLDPNNSALQGYRDGLQRNREQLQRNIREIESQRGSTTPMDEGRRRRSSQGQDQDSGIGYDSGTGSGRDTGGSPETVGWVRAENLSQGLSRIRQDVSQEPGRFDPDNPLKEEKQKVLVLATDAILDIEDAALRARLYKAMTLSLGSPEAGHEARFARLLAVVSQVGYNKARVDHPEVARALQEFFTPFRGADSQAVDPQETLRSLLSGEVSGGITFPKRVSFDVYRRAISAILDGSLAPETIPSGAQREWKEAVASTLTLQEELANVQLQKRSPASQRRLLKAWNRHVGAVQKYLRAYKRSTNQAPPLDQKRNVGFLMPGQQSTENGRPLPPSSNPEPPPGSSLPVAGRTPTDSEADAILIRLRDHRVKMDKLLREVVALVSGERWEDYSNWREAFSFWQWGSAPDSPAEKVVQELHDKYLNRTKDLDNPKSMVGLIREIADIERLAVQRGWVFPTSDAYRKAGTSDADWSKFLKNLDYPSRRLLTIGNFVVQARRDAFVVLALAYRFEQGDFDGLDETARGGYHEGEVKTLDKLFITMKGKDPAFDGLAAAKFLRSKVAAKSLSDKSGKDGTWRSRSANWNAADLLRKLDPAVRYLAAENSAQKDAAMKEMNKVREEWNLLGILPRALHLGRLELERTRQTKDPLDAYRVVLIQEAGR
jgi:hypothetical protein